LNADNTLAGRLQWYDPQPVKRQLVVTANGKERTVSIDGPLDDNRFRIAIDGKERLVDARPIRPGTWSIPARRPELRGRPRSTTWSK